ncbi:MAG: hypothetical protein HOW73_43925 [Polyangiaceae bacterium]|nr:hypothetical protein [Polyangiaceae bacterium]
MRRLDVAWWVTSILAVSTACGDSESSGGAGGSAAGGASVDGGGGTGPVETGGFGSGGEPLDGGGGAGGAPDGLVPAYVVQGLMGRTALSCVGGRTYVADQSEDDAYRCWSGDGTDCDHNAFAGRGLAYGNGVWVATFGWGAPGTLKRSTNGVTWEVVEENTPTYADLAFGNGLFVTNGSTTRISTDGMTWSDGGPTDVTINTRAIEFLPHDGGVFIITGESGEERDIVRSTDGIHWAHASVRPPECGQWVSNLAYGNGVIALFGGAGTVCTSTDGGDTWTAHAVAESLSSHGVWTGSEFFVWSGSTRFRSADGAAWTSDAGTPDLGIGGPVALGASGVFVAVHQSWDNYYEDQRFVFSTDGLNWSEADDYVGGHPVNFLQFGYVEPSDACPLP